MKKTIILITLILISLDVFSQKNIIKGRVIGIPEVKLFSLGIGVERMLNIKFSTQILFNRMGYDMRDTDGNAAFLNILVPELRLFRKKRKQKIVPWIFYRVFKN